MNLPTKLTFVRIFLIPVFVVLFFLPFSFCKIAATAVFMLASFTDFLDGYLARKYNQVTDLGKFLDPIADKMLVACALFAVVCIENPFQLVTVICGMIILSRELMISGLRIVASSKNIVLAADKLGKIKTVLQMIALILLLPCMDIGMMHTTVGLGFWYAGLIVLMLSTVMALVSGGNYLVKNRSVFSETKKEQL